jgi:hypothetical protein
MEGLSTMLVREAPRTEGKASEVWRATRSDFKISKILNFVNHMAADKVSEASARAKRVQKEL